MTNFTFLQLEWPVLHEAASKVEALVYPDPRSASFYARRREDAYASDTRRSRLPTSRTLGMLTS